MAGFPSPASAEFTEQNPFQINSEETLMAFAEYVAEHQDETVYAELTDSFTVQNAASMIVTKPYGGVFEGNNHKITLVNEEMKSNQWFGLFENIKEGAAVRNFDLEVMAWPTDNVTNTYGVCPIAKNNYGAISGVTVDCAILGSGAAAVSGAVYDNCAGGVIENVKVNGWIECGTGSAAGIANRSYPGAVIRRCVNNATVTGSGIYMAGIVGILNGTLEYSANHGVVSGDNTTSSAHTGGLAAQINGSVAAMGKNYEADISNSYNAGRVLGPMVTVTGVFDMTSMKAPTWEGKPVGGLAGALGYTAATAMVDAVPHAFTEGRGIRNSFNYGSVSINTGASAAAIIGSRFDAKLKMFDDYLKDNCEDVYYLPGAAGLVFGRLDSDDAAEGVSDIFKETSAEQFKALHESLNQYDEGNGGTGYEWEAGHNGYPILAALGDKPSEEVSRPPFEDPPDDRDWRKGETMYIGGEADFDAFAQAVADGALYLNAVLTADLKLDGWTPVAQAVPGKLASYSNYNGVFDGNGHTIEMTNMNSKGDTALFYRLGADAVVKNLNAIVHFAGTGGYSAAIACYSEGRIERVTVSGDMYYRTDVRNEYGQVAGIASRTLGAKAVISECANYATITAGFGAGGIVAYFNGTMEYCANYGNIASDSDAGGLMGISVGNTSHISSCYNAGTIEQLLRPLTGADLAGVEVSEESKAKVPKGVGIGGIAASQIVLDYPNNYLKNCFNYGSVILHEEDDKQYPGPIFSGAYHRTMSVYTKRKIESFYYLKSSGGMLFFEPAPNSIDEPWGLDGWGGGTIVEELMLEKSADEFRNGELLKILNDYETSRYPDGSPKWEQGENFPELIVFREMRRKAAAWEEAEDEPDDGLKPAAVITPKGSYKEDDGAITLVIDETQITGLIDDYELNGRIIKGEAAATLVIDVSRNLLGEDHQSGDLNSPLMAVDLLKKVLGSNYENITWKYDGGEFTLNKAAMYDLIFALTDEENGLITDKIAPPIIEPIDEGEYDDKLTEEQQAVVSDAKYRKVYDIFIGDADRKPIENLETFGGGRYNIGLSYELGDGETPDGVWAVYIAENGDTEPMTAGRRYANSKAYFDVKHLSIYSVAYEPVSAATEGGGGGGCASGAGGLSALAALAFAAMRLRGKKPR